MSVIGSQHRTAGGSDSVARFPSNDIISLVGEAPRFDLAESTGPGLRLAEWVDTARELHGDVVLDYGTAPGDRTLREAIAGLHGVDPDEVVVTVGGIHALFLLAFTLCDRGDEVILAEPGFPLARNTLAGVGAAVRSLPLAFDCAYQPDLAVFREMLSAKTRLVSLASPQNPSGVAIPARTLEEMIRSMRERAPQASMIVDETYRQAAYGSTPPAATAAGLGPEVITVASLSKCHGAPGLRIGWAIVRNPALRDQIVTAKFNTVISCSRVDEALAVEVLRQGDRIIRQRSADLGEKLAITAKWVRRHDSFVEWVQPDAGGLCCVRLRRALFDDAGVERFYGALPRQGVRVAPGDWFGEERRIFRLGFGLPAARELEQAMARLSIALERSAERAAAS